MHESGREDCVGNRCGSGIGKASALSLASDGFTMVLAGRNATRLNEVREEISTLKPGRPHIAIAADVRSAESVAALFPQVRERFGRLDVLFNNAGVFIPAASHEDVTVEQ